MYQKLLDHRGAVSVFLVIVLVPTIVCASLFVDASRVKSARGQVSSAGELTLNTVLSQYDVDLNDFYGLMASAQDMDDVISAAGDYFTACIKSQGIDTTDTAKYVNSIKGFFFGDDTISDLLGIDYAESGNAKVEPLKDANLTNPSLIKTQIVEFMKYRSPINSIVGLFEKFQKNAKELENTKKTSDLVDKKQDYYEAQGEVAKKAYEIYQKIMDFDALEITKSDLQEIKEFASGLKEEYKKHHSKMVKDLYNTQGLMESYKKIEYCKTVPQQYKPKAKNKNASAKQIAKKIDSLMRSYNQFITSSNSFNQNVKPWSENGNEYYFVQYWAYCCKRVNYFTAVHDKEFAMIEAFNTLRDMYEHAEDGATSEIYTSTYRCDALGVYSGMTKSISEWYDFLKQKVKSAADSVTGKKTRYNNTVVKVTGDNLIVDIVSTYDTDNKLAELYSRLSDYNTRYEYGFKLLGEIVSGLAKLKKLVIDADNKFETWESKADEYKNSIQLAENDKKEITQVKQDYVKLSESDIDDYSNHINNVKSVIGTIRSGIKKVSYNGQSIVDKKINGYSAFKKNSNVLESEIPMYKADLEEYVEETFDFSIDQELQNLNITDKNDPKIASVKYEVYSWMLKQNFNEPKDEEKEKKYNDLKKKSKKNADEAKKDAVEIGSKNDISSLKGLPSGGSKDKLDEGKITTKIKEVSNFVGKMFSNFGGTVSKAGTDARDALFVLDYITSMFTYQTFEYEAKYDMLDTTQKNNITYSNYSNYYDNLATQWEDADVTKKFNKTLTNKLRNSQATNWSYCNEVEYIMYGKSNNDSKKAINGTIYAVRFALNIPCIFSTFYNDDWLKGFAYGVNLATHGIIPEGLVKVIICLGLTAMETTRDLQTLKRGIPSILVKTKLDDLFVQNCEFGTNPRPKTNRTSVITFSYSDYMKLFLFLKLIGSESSGIYKRTADVIQVNMSKCVLKNDKYVLSKSQVYYTINAECTVKPLMLNTGYVESFFPGAAERMNNWNKISYKVTRGY